jgi:type IX secretion system PorP/SprF family membrane protein
MKKTFALILLAIAGVANAQQDYSFTQYNQANAYFNPAATGTENVSKVVGLWRKQWVGFNGSPMSYGLLYETPIEKKNIGVGGYVFQDVVGATALTTVAANYSYYLNITDYQRISFGINAGADFLNTNYDDLRYWDEADAVFTNPANNFVLPKVGIGVMYYTNQFYVGISVPRLLNYNSDQFNSIQNSNVPVMVSNYFATAGAKFKLNDDFNMDVFSLLKYTPKVMPQLDINTSVWYKDMISVGAGYKSMAFATMFMQYKYKEFVLGYAFDFSLTPMSQYSKGTHELLLRYNIKSFRNTLNDKPMFK